MKIKNIIEEYQCSGCVCGNDFECYEKSRDLACGRHVVGTTITSIGRLFLGMPNGFNRVGPWEQPNINIFEKLEDGWGYDKFNIPVWKYKDKYDNIIVRGVQPRLNFPFIHIFLENCLDNIDCLEITNKDIEGMD